jgi:hypothetical protein
MRLFPASPASAPAQHSLRSPAFQAALIAACALGLAACEPSSADTTDQWRAVDVTVTPVDFGAETVGRLRYRGGIALSSDSALFGGLSGLEVLDDGRLLAISDNGIWFDGRLDLDESGALIGVSGVRLAMMRDEGGVEFPSKATGDSEGLTQLPDGRFAVSFEQTPLIRIYDLNRDGPFGAAQVGPRLDEVARLPRNVGLEAIAATSEGGLLIGAEGGDEETTPMWVAPLGASEPVAPRIGYPLRGGFSLTGLDRLPDGDFIALERFYAPVIGPRALITRFSEASLNARGEALPEVEELALLRPPLPIDNFESVSAVRMPDGATRIYILSDDNFRSRQRTLLLAFDVMEQEAVR